MEYAGSIEELKELWVRAYTGQIVKWAINDPSANVEAAVPALAGNDRFVFAATPESLRNKTIGTGSTVMGWTETVAGYLTVSESVPAFMAAWRAWFQPNPKAAAWESLSASDIENLDGVTSSIQTQFGANFSEHISFRARLTALEGASSGRPASAHITIDSAVKTDLVGALFTTAIKTFAAPATLTLYGTPDEGAMYVISNKAAGDLTVSSWTVAEGGYLWLRYVAGNWLAIESGGAVLPSELIEIVDIPGGADVADTSSQNIVFVRRTTPSPGGVIFANPAVSPDKIYFCSNFSAESNLICTDFTESATYTIPPREWAVFSYNVLNAQWVMMESGLLDQAEGGSVQGLNQSSIELTSNTEDTSTYDWLFVEKLVADPFTFTLRATPTTGTLIQIKNSASAGDITVGGNGNLIGGVGSITVVPGAFAWFLFRAGAWYLLETYLTPTLLDEVTLPIASACVVVEGEPAQWLDSSEISVLIESSDTVVGNIMVSEANRPVKAVQLTLNTFVLLYRGADTYLKLRVITRNGTTLIVGPERVVINSAVDYLDMTRLNDTQVVLKYMRNCRVATVAGDNITLGTAVAFTTEDVAGDLFRIADNKFCIAYQISTGIKMRCATVATATITYGTVLSITSSFANRLGTVQIDDTRFLMVSGVGINTFYKVITNTSGTTLAQGTEFIADQTDYSIVNIGGVSIDGNYVGLGLYGNDQIESSIVAIVHYAVVQVTSATVNSVNFGKVWIPAATRGVGQDFYSKFGPSLYCVSPIEKDMCLSVMTFSASISPPVISTQQISVIGEPTVQPTNWGGNNTRACFVPFGDLGILFAEGAYTEYLNTKLVALVAPTAGVASLYRTYATYRSYYAAGMNMPQMLPTLARYEVWASLRFGANGAMVEVTSYPFTTESSTSNLAVSSYNPRNTVENYPNQMTRATPYIDLKEPLSMVVCGPEYVVSGTYTSFAFSVADNGTIIPKAKFDTVLPAAGQANSKGQAATMKYGDYYYRGDFCTITVDHMATFPNPPQKEGFTGLHITRHTDSSYIVTPLLVEGGSEIAYPKQHDMRLHDSSLSSGSVAGYAGIFYVQCLGTIYTYNVADATPDLLDVQDVTLLEQWAARPQLATWATGVTLTYARKMFPFIAEAAIWMALLDGARLQLARAGATTTAVTISTRTYASLVMEVIQISPTLLLACYAGNDPSEFFVRAIELSGTSLLLGTEYRLPFPNTIIYGGVDVFHTAGLGMLGDKNFILASINRRGTQFEIPLQVLDRNTVRPAIEVGLAGEYLGLVTSITPTTATIKLGPVVGGLTGLTPGSKYFVSEPGGLTSVPKLPDTRVGRALSTTTIRQRGPLVD
jgi:hypothetical protein